MYRWQLARGNEALEVQVDGPLTVSDNTLALQAAEAGAGLAYAFSAQAADALAAGRLVQVLADWTPPAEPLFLYYPSRRLQPAGLQAFIDWVRTGAVSTSAVAPTASL